MKKLKVLGLAAIAAGMVTLTSCLDGGGNKQTLQSYAIVDYSSTMRKLIYPLGYYPLYIPAVANDVNYNPGDCVIANYTVDFDSPDNANASTNGFYVASGAASSALPKYNFSFSESDSTALEGEVLLSGAESVLMMSANYQRIIAEPIFESILTDQKNDYRLMFDYDQEPATVNSTERVYTLYLRCQKLTDGKAPTLSNAKDAAIFDAGQFYSTLKSRESAAGKKVASYQVKYAKSFNSDSTKVMTWGVSNISQFSIAESE